MFYSETNKRLSHPREVHRGCVDGILYSMFHKHMALWAGPAFRESGPSELDSIDTKNHACTSTLVTDSTGDLFFRLVGREWFITLSAWDCQRLPCVPCWHVTCIVFLWLTDSLSAQCSIFICWLYNIQPGSNHIFPFASLISYLWKCHLPLFIQSMSWWFIKPETKLWANGKFLQFTSLYGGESGHSW